jgi:GWxTD domain-containing protein
MNFWTGLGWAIVHFLWQGALIACVLFIALRCTTSPRLRHGFAATALLLMPFCFFFTAWRMAPIEPSRIATRLVPLPQAAGTGELFLAPQSQLAQLLPWLTWLWIAGVVLLAMYRVYGWLLTRRLRQKGICAPSAEWQKRVRLLSQRMGVTRIVSLLESSLVEVPVVIGWLRPVLLLPVGMLTSLPVSQVEAILLHELAHVYRRDALINLAQLVVESLLFHHPAVWWVSRVIRLEREKCCDDLVVNLQGDRSGYVAALLTLEERRANRLEPALAATGGDLMQRVRRLLGRPEEPTGGPALVISMGALLGVLCLAAMAQETTGPYQNWLTQDAAYIIKDDEKSHYRTLKTDTERAEFIEQFWRRRDPRPETEENEFRTEHYRRIRYANERFASSQSGWKTALGRIYITLGPPDEIEIHPQKKQQWLYRELPGVGSNVILSFTYKDGEYIWDSDPNQ